jgi:hypothetical protein
MIRNNYLEVSIIYLKIYCEIKIYLNSYFIELDHVGVSDYFQNVNFTRNSFHIRLVFDLVFFENFDRHLLSGDQMGSEPNFAESTLTERFA